MIREIITGFFNSLFAWLNANGAKGKLAVDAQEKHDDLQRAAGRIAEYERMQQDGAGERSKPD